MFLTKTNLRRISASPLARETIFRIKYDIMACAISSAVFSSFRDNCTREGGSNSNTYLIPSYSPLILWRARHLNMSLSVLRVAQHCGVAGETFFPPLSSSSSSSLHFFWMGWDLGRGREGREGREGERKRKSRKSASNISCSPPPLPSFLPLPSPPLPISFLPRSAPCPRR